MTKSATAGLERAISAYLPRRRWFRGKTGTIEKVTVKESAPLGSGVSPARLLLARVACRGGSSEIYSLFLSGRPGPKGARLQEAVGEATFAKGLLVSLVESRTFSGARGRVAFHAEGSLRTAVGRARAGLAPSISAAEQSNTSIRFGRRYMLKLYRRVEAGVHPDLELGRLLAERGFQHTPTIEGCIEYVPARGDSTVLGLLQGFVKNKGDGWSHARAAVSKCLSSAGAAPLLAGPRLLGSYGRFASLLGQRTAEMHLALGAESKLPDFAPEPFTVGGQRSLRDRLVRQARRTLKLLEGMMKRLPAPVREQARRVVSLRGEVEARFDEMLECRCQSSRIRCHGDYHLGQVLFTGSDFVITDFEGEVSRPLDERRAKSSPLKDVAGMIRSFHYAAHAELLERKLSRAALARLEPRASAWHAAASMAFFIAYLKTFDARARASGRFPKFFPGSREEGKVLLHTYLLEKSIYEIDYELHHRPDWLKIPLEGVLEIMGTV